LDASDSTLVKQWQAGDRDAFAEAARRYARAMGAVAYAIVGDVHMAEDVVQESFARAAKRIAHIQRDERLGPYLTGITRNVALDAVRRRARNGRAVESPTVERRDPLTRARQSELREHLSAALKALPQDQQEIFALKYISGMQYGQISQALGISEGAVAQKLLRVRRKLQDALQEFRS
jgi:RNA polymerase sigma-70 factor (ECF subfamily)